MEGKRGRKDLTGWCFGFYLLAVFFTLAIFFATFFADRSDSEPGDFAGAWYADEAMTEPANLRHPQLTDRTGIFYAAVPQDIKRGDCLWFKLKNAYITVEVEGEERLRIEESATDEMLYGKTPGTDWICVPLETRDAGSLIVIRFYTKYNDTSAYLTDIRIGGALSALRSHFAQMLPGIFVCLLMFVYGIVLIFGFLAMRWFVKKTLTELLYLGCCLFFTSIWLMSELRVFQLFTERSAGIFHNLTCMAMMLISMPLVLHFKKDFDRVNRLIAPFMSLVSVANILVCCLLHFAQIADFHETLVCTHITIGLTAAFVVYVNVLRIVKTKKRSKTDVFPAVCMVLVALCSVADIFLYRSGISRDSAFLTRIAGFIYAISLGISSITYITDILRKGMRADIISRLAYEDGLTGLGNRTAYNEQLEKLKGKTTTVFVFDINDLKQINDRSGHQVGDELIRAGAEIIDSVFGKIGNCYRVGGDEFVCLIEGNADAKKLSEEFYQKIDEYNRINESDFRMMIALGYEKYDGTADIGAAVNTADRRMYAKKVELKKEG